MTIVNVEYIAALTQQIESADSCAALQQAAAEVLAAMQAQTDVISAQLEVFAPYIELLTAPTDPESVVEWIFKLIETVIRPMTVPFYTYQAQMTAQIAAVAALVAAITEKAASFPSCAVQVSVVGE